MLRNRFDWKGAPMSSSNWRAALLDDDRESVSTSEATGPAQEQDASGSRAESAAQ